MLINRKMNDYLSAKSFLDIGMTLINKIDSNFIIRDEYVILNQFINNAPSTDKSFFDKIGYECFVNHFHGRMFISDNILSESFCFLKYVLTKWKLLKNEKILVGILSYNNDDDDSNIRFYKYRDGETYLSDDLDSYNEAILVMNSNDILL